MTNKLFKVTAFYGGCDRPSGWGDTEMQHKCFTPTPEMQSQLKNEGEINKISKSFETSQALKDWEVKVSSAWADGKIHFSMWTLLKHTQSWKYTDINGNTHNADAWFKIDSWDQFKLISNGVDSAVFQGVNKNGKPMGTLIIESSKERMPDGSIVMPKSFQP